MRQQEVVYALQAVTATTTSVPINIAGATKVTFIFKRSNHSSGSTAFTVTVSADDSTYIAYAKLIQNVANTNGQTQIRVASYDTGTANASATFSMSPEDAFKFIKVTATETTDGTHDAWVIIERDV